MQKVPTDVQFNPLSTSAVNFYVKAAVHAWSAQVTTTSDPPTFVPMAVKNWSLDGKTFTVEMNDSFTWHHGKSLTAKDLALHYRLDKFMEAGKYYDIWDMVDSMEVTNKYTLEMQLSEKTIEELVVPKAFGEPLAYDPKTFGKYLKRFEESPKGKHEDIKKDVTEMTIDKPVGAGPLKFVSSDKQKMVFEPYQKFPWSEVQKQFSDTVDADITNWPDKLNFSKVHFRYVPGDRLPQAIKSGSVDGGFAVDSIDTNNLPSQYEAVEIPGLYGWSLIYNFWNSGIDAWRDPMVRKALTYVFDRKAIATQFRSKGVPEDKYITGMTRSQEKTWLDKSFMNSLDRYKRDTGKATKLLKQAGYTQKDGKWYKPNGDRFVAEFKTASGVTRYVNGLQVAVSNLKQFGIKATLQTEESTTYFSKPPNEQGYQIEAAPNYGGARPFPYFAFNSIYLNEQIENNNETDYYLPGDETLEVPPVGKPKSNETITVDPKASLSKLGSTTEKKAQTEIIKKLAWATNQAVPQIPIVEAALEGVLSTDGWKYPPTEHPAMNMKSAAFLGLMFQLGVIKAT